MHIGEISKAAAPNDGDTSPPEEFEDSFSTRALLLMQYEGKLAMANSAPEIRRELMELQIPPISITSEVISDVISSGEGINDRSEFLNSVGSFSPELPSYFVCHPRTIGKSSLCDISYGEQLPFMDEQQCRIAYNMEAQMFTITCTGKEVFTRVKLGGGQKAILQRGMVCGLGKCGQLVVDAVSPGSPGSPPDTNISMRKEEYFYWNRNIRDINIGPVECSITITLRQNTIPTSKYILRYPYPHPPDYNIWGEELEVGRQVMQGAHRQDDTISRRHARVRFDPSVAAWVLEEIPNHAGLFPRAGTTVFLRTANQIDHKGRGFGESDALSLTVATKLLLGPYIYTVLYSN